MASSSLFPDQVIGLNKTEWEFVVRRSLETKVLELETYDDEIAKEEHSRSRVIVRNCSDIFVPGDGVQKLGLNNLNTYFGKTVARLFKEGCYGYPRSPSLGGPEDKVKLDMLAYGKFVTPPSFFCTDAPIPSYLQRGTYVSEFHVDESSGGNQSLSTLPGIKIWAIFPCFSNPVRKLENIIKAALTKKKSGILKAMEEETCEVIIALPGDLVIFRAGDWHAVITVYPLKTPKSKQFAFVQGPAFFTKHDLAGGMRLINRYRGARNETEKFVVSFFYEAMAFFYGATTTSAEEKRKFLENLAKTQGVMDDEMAKRGGATKRKNSERASNFSKKPKNE